MVGAILSRVLSRHRTSTSTGLLRETSRDEKQAQTHTQQVSTTTSPYGHITMAVDQSSKPCGETTKIRSLSHVGLEMSPRKHSYASIREDSDVPQSFCSRRIHHDGLEGSKANRTRLSSGSLAQPDFTPDAAREVIKILDQDESAILDDEELYNVSSETSSGGESSGRSFREPHNLDTMPDEILDLIFSCVTLDTSKDRLMDPRVDLFSCLFVSKAVHASALRVLYKHVKMPQSKAFNKFSNALSEDPVLGSLVQCLDFSHYSSIGFGRARSAHVITPYLTPTTLKACLDRLTNLRAFLVHEHVDDELDSSVLSRLFEMTTLQALDLCACSSTMFTNAFTSVCTTLSPTNFLSIERLSLHECTTLKSQVFEALLPRLDRLTHLDVAHTMINGKALLSIPTTARITHLNLERCTQITGRAVVEFVTTHPAIMNSVVYLNIMADASRYRLLSEDDLSELLPALPATLKSLNIGGARVDSSHTYHLRALATHLEELGLKGANLSLSGDVSYILSLISSDKRNEIEHPEWTSSLRYIDLKDVKSVSKMSLTYHPESVTEPESMPLEVIEIGETIMRDLDRSLKKVKNPEWVVRELGRRGWYVRQPSSLNKGSGQMDDGYRPWKMGARWWGMRKIPVFEQDTGGMYGYYMFKRN